MCKKLEIESLFLSVTKGITEAEKKEQLFFTVTKLFQDLRNLKSKKPVDILNYLIHMGYKESLVEFAKFLKQPEKTFTNEFDELNDESKKFESMSEWDSAIQKRRDELKDNQEKNKEEGIQLSTFHSAKGLQWKKVIIISAIDGVVPCIRKNDNDLEEKIEEERRLFYVALTRAEDDITIIYQTEGNGITRSRFLAELQIAST